MSSLSDRARSKGRAFGLGLLDYDNKIFGAILTLVAIDNWRGIWSRLDEYSIYLMNGIYVTPLLSLVVLAFSAVYSSAVSIILLTATRPVARSETLLPNFLAVLGGFGVYCFGLLTPAETRPFGIWVPLGFMASGTGIVLLSLTYLRRAFSVTPQARTVVQSGPYSFVRHPMYIGNILWIVGLGLIIGTFQALMLTLAACTLQVCRALYEDRLLQRTFVEHESYMSQVGAFFPRFRFPRHTRVFLLLLAMFALYDQHAWTQVSPDATQTFEPKCRAWRQKALSGQWFTKREGEEFEQTADIQDRLRSIPACRDFFALQRRCQEIFEGFEGEGARGNDAIRRYLNSIVSNSGCKSIIGYEEICDVLLDAGRAPSLPPAMRSILAECADESIGSRVAHMLRPAL